MRNPSDGQGGAWSSGGCAVVGCLASCCAGLIRRVRRQCRPGADTARVAWGCAYPERNRAIRRWLRHIRPRTGMEIPNIGARRDLWRLSPAGFEPATFGSGGQRSVQLSYGDASLDQSRTVGRPVNPGAGGRCGRSLPRVGLGRAGLGASSPAGTCLAVGAGLDCKHVATHLISRYRIQRLGPFRERLCHHCQSHCHRSTY